MNGRNKNTKASFITVSSDNPNSNELYAIILDYNEPKELKNDDTTYMQSVSIMTLNQHEEPIYKRLNFYSTTKELLPNIEKNDEIIYITKFKMDSVYEFFIANELSEWIIFKQHKGDFKKSRHNSELNTYNDMIYKLLKQKSDNKKGSYTFSTNNDKGIITKTEDLKLYGEHNFIGQVVSYSLSIRNKILMTNLLLTDYTENEIPVKLGSKKGNDYSIEKKYLLQCTLFEQNATGCPDLSFGDYVYIEDTYCKLSSNGTLELKLSGSSNAKEKKYKKYPRIHILNKDDERVRNLNKQKYLYETRNKRLPENNDDSLINISKKYNDSSIEMPKKHNGHPSIKSPKKHSVYTKCKQTPPKYSTIAEVINGKKETKYFLHGSIVDYKPKDISEINRMFCKQCNQSFNSTIKSCSLCQNTNLIQVHRCMLLFEEANGDSLILGAVGTEENPLFHNISPLKDIENESTNQDICNRLEALCKLNGNISRFNYDLCVMGFQSNDKKEYVITETEIYYE